MRRSELDRPAAATAAILGIALIAVSAPFAYLLLEKAEQAGDMFTITYPTDELGSVEAAVDGGSTTDEAQVVVSGPVADAVLTFPRCDDSANPQLQQNEAVLLYEVTATRADGAAVDLGADAQGQFPCDDAPSEVVLNGTVVPELGEIRAHSADEAEQEARSRLGNETVTYTLRLTVTRQAGPLSPLPVAQPTFFAEALLTVRGHDPVATEQQEVVR